MNNNTSLAIGATSFGISAVGNFITSLTRLSSLRDSAADAHHILLKFRSQVESCLIKLETWDNTWGSNQYPDTIYLHLWDSSYHAITDTRNQIIGDLDRLTESIKERIKRLDAYGTLGLRRVLFALFQEQSFIITISSLVESTNRLDELSKQRLMMISGPESRNILPEPMLRSTLIRSFGQQELHRLLRLQNTSDWALELRNPAEDGMNAERWLDLEHWQDFRDFVVGFTYSSNAGDNAGENVNQIGRISLIYQHRNAISMGWAEQIALPRNPPPNPTVTPMNPFTQRTDTLASLFRRGIFAHTTSFKKWEADQALLLFTLCNWTIMFWGCHWIFNICCSQIRFLQGDGFRLYSLGRCPDPPIPHHDGHCDDDHCHHAMEMLQNLGIVLAEIICATPFRQSRNPTLEPYEEWDIQTREWLPRSQGHIMKCVKTKSKSSEQLVDAVRFCLDSVDPGLAANGSGGFTMQFIEKVLIPTKTFYDNAQSNHTTWLERLSDFSVSWATNAL